MVEQISSLKTGVKYKDTPIGKVPVDWEVVRLENISLKFYNGGTPDTTNKDYWNGKIPWVTGADFENQKVGRIRRYISDEGVKNSATNIVQKGNILVVTRTGVGKLAIAPVDIAISQDITGVVLDQEKALPTYIYWYLNYSENRLKSIVQGTSINGLLRDDLESIAVSLPPLSEQKKIAQIISTLDDAIEKTRRIIDTIKKLKKGLMQKLFTEGVGHTRFKQTKVGKIPEEWKVIKLGKIVPYDKPITYGIVQAGSHVPNGVPYIRSGDLNNPAIEINSLLKTSEEIAQKYKRSEIGVGDIIFSLIGNIGVTKVVPPELIRANLTQGTARITCRPGIFNQYLNLALQSPNVNKRINAVAKGSTFNEISLEELRKLMVPIPDINEQYKIAEILIEIDTNIEKESNHLEQLKLLKKGLMQVLLTGKLRVTV